MRTALFIFTLLLYFNKVHCQTNVGGGIFTNTTWTAANSPYIVIGTIVVFPGVTLSIEPGVTVIFNNNLSMEIRQATLIAEGTVNDSINFVGISLQPGSWNGIKADTSSVFKFCNFRDATTAITGSFHVKNSTFKNNDQGINYCTVDSSVFVNNNIAAYIGIINYCIIKYNQVGISYIGEINNCIIDSNLTGVDLYAGSLNNCEVKFNQDGVYIDVDGKIVNSLIHSNYLSGVKVELEIDSVYNCVITNNGGAGIDLKIGISSTRHIAHNRIENNDVGVVVNSTNDSIYCNQICNNNLYDLKYGGTTNYILPGNFWCTDDSMVLSTRIYDGYDNISYGLVSFFPIDTTGCNLVLNQPDIDNYKNIVNIFPNPFTSEVSINTNVNEQIESIQIINNLDQEIYSATVKTASIKINTEKWQNGIYYCRLNMGNKVVTKKVIKVR